MSRPPSRSRQTIRNLVSSVSLPGVSVVFSLPIRLLGFGVSKLDDSGKAQLTLFDQPDRKRHQELDRVADQITKKFGKLAIRRGTRLEKSDE